MTSFEPTLGEHIARRRGERQMSQADLAAAVGVTRTAVSSWENGRSRPRDPEMASLRNVLGHDFDRAVVVPFDGSITVAELQRRTAEALIRQLCEYAADGGEIRYGWRQDLDDPGQAVTALSTAYGMQAVLQAVGPDRRLSLPRLRAGLRHQELAEGGWSPIRKGTHHRPEVSVVVVAALREAGEDDDYLASRTQLVVETLERAEGPQWSRPYVMATTVLELAGLAVDDTAGRQLVERLVEMSVDTEDGGRAWPAHLKHSGGLAGAPTPSTAHTAIAVCALAAWARRLDDDGIQEMADAGRSWLERRGDLALEDEWYSDGDDPLIPVRLFTPAWVLRAVIEPGGDDTGPLAARALGETLRCYDPSADLWYWPRHGGMFPVWMTSQGLAAMAAWGGARRLS